jgi:hypothetical protein
VKEINAFCAEAKNIIHRDIEPGNIKPTNLFWEASTCIHR